MKSVCVFCGSSIGSKPIYAETAAKLGKAIAERGWRLIYGGGNVGLMGAVADGALLSGGEVIGVIPQALLAKELGHQGLTELRVVRSMHERKAMMADLTDAFLALPGGFGTFEEYCEVLTWAQLGIHTKPCGLLNIAGYYDPLLAMFDHAVSERFLRPEHRNLVLIETSIDTMLDALANYQPLILEKWLDQEET